jgi:sugar/nucleoside kinase (ribokinase family)
LPAGRWRRLSLRHEENWMADARFDVVGIGNAIVDVLSHTDDAFLAEVGLTKGTMALIDAERAEQLYAAMGPGTECSGGSCANTMAGLAALGARAAYIGKVRNDEFGRIFAHDMRGIGVAFDTPAAADSAPTARCLILVTPDAQRTMNTYLGACVELGPDDVDPSLIAESKIVYLEGYLWDPPAAKDAIRKAVEIAHQHGRQVALTLSDPFCVERHREEFRALVENDVDILFANEHEIVSLYEVAGVEEALQRVRGRCSIVAVTRSEHGSVVMADGHTHVVPAEPVERVVDTTGAGDLYAAGFLSGLVQGLNLRTCARIGSIAAADIISRIGARSDVDLAALVQSRLG